MEGKKQRQKKETIGNILCIVLEILILSHAKKIIDVLIERDRVNETKETDS